MKFVTSGVRLLLSRDKPSGGLDEIPPRLTCDYGTTVDGRPVRDVLDGDCGYIVIELDNTESRWRK